jgi:hypothetical protein
MRKTAASVLLVILGCLGVSLRGVWAQSAAYQNPHVQLFCAVTGASATMPCAGGKLYTYLAGTTTQAATYSNSTGTLNANPIVLDANGYARIYMGTTAYKFCLNNAFGVQQWCQDNIRAANPLALVVSGTPVTGQGPIWNGTNAAWGNLAALPWVDLSKIPGVDCTGATDSRAGLVAGIGSGTSNRYVAPPGCKLQIAANAGAGLVLTGINGYGTGGAVYRGNVDIYGSDQAEIFGCGAGTGAVVNYNRSAYFHFHGFNIETSDVSLCPSGSTFTKPLMWSNNGGGGFTSTHAEFDHLILSAGSGFAGGGTIYPTVGTWGMAARAGNQVAYLFNPPLWANPQIHQDSATNIVNGTAYSASVYIASPSAPWSSGTYNSTPGSASIAITANGVVVATNSACTVATNTWNQCTVNYTGTAGTAGQLIGVRLTNTTTTPSGTYSELFFDTVATTNFAVSNTGFENMVGGATPLSADGYLNPAVASWTGMVNGATAPTFAGLQIGSAYPEANLEGASFHDIDCHGLSTLNSYCIINNGNASEHLKFENIGAYDVWRGIYGTSGAVMTNIYGGGPDETYSNYQRFGVAGGALVMPTICAGTNLTITSLTWDGFGPLFKHDGGGACPSVTLINPAVLHHVVAPGEYDIDVSNILSVSILGGAFGFQYLGGTTLTNNAFVGSDNVTATGVQVIGTQVDTGYEAVAKLSNLHPLLMGLTRGNAISAGDITQVQPVNSDNTRPSPVHCQNAYNSFAAEYDSWCFGTVGVLNGGQSRTLVSNYTPPTGYTRVTAVGFDSPFSGISTATISAVATNLAAAATGTLGATTYTYKIVIRGGAGTTAASAAVSVANGNATLSGSNCVQVKWNAANNVAGEVGFDVYRTVGGATQGKLLPASASAADATIGALAAAAAATNAGAEYSYTDCGATGDGTAVPTEGTTGRVDSANGVRPANGVAPTCSATWRGFFWYAPGAGGVKDVVEVCGKDAADVYAWRAIY